MAFRAVHISLGIRKCLQFLMLYIMCSNLVTKATATFMVEDSSDNEVIFVGETVVLQCEAPVDVDNPTYILLDSQGNDLPNVITYPTPSSPRGYNFQVTFTDVSQNRLFCKINGDRNVELREELSLVVRNEQPVCYIDSDPVFDVGDLVELACYRYGRLGMSSGALWRQVKNGVAQEVSNLIESDLINQAKRKTLAIVNINSDDRGSFFECELMMTDGGSLSCSTPIINVQQQNTLTVSIATTPSDNEPLGRDGSILATCESSDPTATITWENNYEPSDVIHTPVGNNIIIVSIPETSTLSSGTVLAFTCTAILGIQRVSSTFMISVIFPTTPVATVPLDFTLWITPNNPEPIGINQEFTATCHSSISGAFILWANDYAATDINYRNAGDTITVSVPQTTTLTTGTNLIFSCVGILQGRQKIATFTIQLIFSTPTTVRPAQTLEITTNNLGTIGIHEEFSATCRSSSAGATILWFHDYSDTDITYTNHENVITVSIPESTTLTPGTNLVFTCLCLPTSATTTLEVQFIVSSTKTSLTATTNYTSMVTTESTGDNQTDLPNDPIPILYYILGGVFAAVLVAIIIIIIVLICLTQQSHPKRKSFHDDGHGHNTTFNSAYVDQPSANGGHFQDTQPTSAHGGDDYSRVDKANGFHVHPDPRDGDGVSYSDVNRRRVSIHEEDIYNDSLGWNSEI